MIIRTTTDPMTLHDVKPLPDQHPCLFEGDDENGLEIYFESEQTRREYMELHPHDPKILAGKDDENYVPEG
jgi:hypothetical protein